MNDIKLYAVERGDSTPALFLCWGDLLILVTCAIICGYLEYKVERMIEIKYFYKEDLNTNIENCNYIEQLCRV